MAFGEKAGELLLCRGVGPELKVGQEVFVHTAANPAKRWEDYMASPTRLPDWRHGRGIEDVVCHRIGRGRVVEGEHPEPQAGRGGYVTVEMVEIE